MQIRNLALTTGPDRPYGRRMTSHLIIEKLIADRRADLARSWPRHTRPASPSDARREAFDDAA